MARASLTSPGSCVTDELSNAVALELGGDCDVVAPDFGGDCDPVASELGSDCGAVGGDCTATEPQATAARVTEIPRNASLIRDAVSPKVENSTGTSKALPA
jgi:hypothetical protein